MSCREIKTSVLDSARSLEDVYSQLGVLVSSDKKPLAPPVYIRPDGIPVASLPYLGGTDGKDYNLGILYDDEGLECLLTSLRYDNVRASEIDKDVKAFGADQTATDAYLEKLGVGDRRTYSIFTTLTLLEYFRGKGNTDGKQNTISERELATWAWEACGKNKKTHQSTATTAITRFHALLGLATYLSTPAPPPSLPLESRPGVSLNADQGYNLPAPQGGNLTVNEPEWSMPSWLPYVLGGVGAVVMAGIGILLGKSMLSQKGEPSKPVAKRRPVVNAEAAEAAALNKPSQRSEFYIGRNQLDPELQRTGISRKQIQVIVEDGVYKLVNNKDTAEMAEIDRNGTTVAISTDPAHPTTIVRGDILRIGLGEFAFDDSGSPKNPAEAFQRISPKAPAPVPGKANPAPLAVPIISFSEEDLAQLEQDLGEEKESKSPLRPASPPPALKALSNPAHVKLAVRVAIAELYPESVKEGSDPKDPAFKPGYETYVKETTEAVAKKNPASFQEVLTLTADVGNARLSSMVQGAANGQRAVLVPLWEKMIARSKTYVGEEKNVKGFAERLLERTEKLEAETGK